jgi:hypothetical protein
MTNYTDIINENNDKIKTLKIKQENNNIKISIKRSCRNDFFSDIKDDEKMPDSQKKEYDDVCEQLKTLFKIETDIREKIKNLEEKTRYISFINKEHIDNFDEKEYEIVIGIFKKWNDGVPDGEKRHMVNYIHKVKLAQKSSKLIQLNVTMTQGCDPARPSFDYVFMKPDGIIFTNNSYYNQCC